MAVVLPCSECVRRSKRAAKGWKGIQLLEVVQGWWGYLQYGLPCVLMVCLEVRGWPAALELRGTNHFKHFITSAWSFTLATFTQEGRKGGCLTALEAGVEGWLEAYPAV